MPDIDPAALSRPTPNASTGISPLMMTKAGAAASTSSTTPVTTSQTPKSSKSSTMAPRLELEGPYTQLKAVIGEGWGAYKEAMGLYFLGHINSSELSYRLQPLLTDPLAARRHNSLVAVLTANIARDLPDPGVVAPFVSANDKPSAAISKPSSGDAAEQRLKTEVMGLPARDRRRIKEVGREAAAAAASAAGPAATQSVNAAAPPDDPSLHADAEFVAKLREERKSKEIRVPDTAPQSAGGLSKTNWALSILPLYTAPTTIETFDLPSLTTLTSRLQPMCYSHSLAQGAAPTIAPLLLTALNTHIKTLLTSILTKTRSNGPPLTGLNTASTAVAAASVGGTASFVTTKSFRDRLDREEQSWLRGQNGVQRGVSGRLPVERKEVLAWESIGPSDLKVIRGLGGDELGDGAGWGLGWDADDYWTGSSRPDEFAGAYIGVDGELVPSRASGAVKDLADGDPMDIDPPIDTNDIGTAENGVHHDRYFVPNEYRDEDDDVDGDGNGWEGGGFDDRNALGQLLGECLALGS